MLGVVPIFVSGGAALLPAIVAGVVSAGALLFKPRALAAACRRRPYVPVAILLVGAGIWFGVARLNAKPTVSASSLRAGGGAVAAAGSVTDWRAVALAVLAGERTGERPAQTAQGAEGAEGAADARPVGLGYDVTRRGHDGGPAPTELRPAARFIVPEDAHRAMILSSPVVAGGRAFVATAVLDPPGNYGTFFALDALTLEQLWAVEEIVDPVTGGRENLKGFFSTPVVSADGQRVVVGQGLHPDANCSLLCFDAATGRLLWRVESELHIESSPAIDGNLVVVGCGAIEDAADNTRVLGHTGYVLAVDLETGRELWRYDVRDPESSPAIVEGIAYIGSGFNGRAIYALRTGTEEELKAQGRDRLVWKYDAPYPVTGAITVAGDLILAGGGNGDYIFSARVPAGVVLAVDRADGRLRWQTEIGDSVLGHVAYRDGVAIATSRTGEVIALAAEDGRILWRQPLSGEPILTGPAYAGRYAYAASKEGYLAVFDVAEGGKLLKRAYLNDPAHPGELGLTISSPMVVGGSLYVGSETGGVWRFE